jgi:hypothetical protein
VAAAQRAELQAMLEAAGFRMSANAGCYRPLLVRVLVARGDLLSDKMAN